MPKQYTQKQCDAETVLNSIDAALANSDYLDVIGRGITEPEVIKVQDDLIEAIRRLQNFSDGTAGTDDV